MITQSDIGVVSSNPSSVHQLDAVACRELQVDLTRQDELVRRTARGEQEKTAGRKC